MKQSDLKSAFKDSLPIMAGYIVLGIAFGILLSANGYGFIWAFVMSLTIYAGSMQFVAVGLLSGGASLISSAVMTLLVNARHIIYGISMVKKYRGLKAAKPYLIFALTDETYALVSRENIKCDNPEKYYLFMSLLNQLYWIAGCSVGGIIGNAVTFNTSGIDFAMTALFVVIFIDRLFSKEQIIPAVIGVACSVLCLLIFGADGFLIPSMIMISLLLYVYAVIYERRTSIK